MEADNVEPESKDIKSDIEETEVLDIIIKEEQPKEIHKNIPDNHNNEIKDSDKENETDDDDNEEEIIMVRRKRGGKKVSNSTVPVMQAFSSLAMNWLFVLLMILQLFAKSSAAPSGFPGYKPTAGITDFRNMKHNPRLEQFLRNINNVNESISTVQADHIAIKSFVHPINETL